MPNTVTNPPLLDSTGQTIVSKLDDISQVVVQQTAIATTATAGVVKVDGETITVDANGTISAPNTGTTIVQIPTVTGTSFTYNGSSQGPTVTGVDTDKVTVTGTSGTNAGNYTVVCSLKNAQTSVWSDLTTANKSTSWTIAKASQSISASSSSVTLNSSTLTTTVTISGCQTSLTATSSDTTVATVSVSGNTLTISSVNSKSGDTTISVQAVSGTNYNASSSISISVSAQFVPIKTFAAATDEEIAQMVAAADAGQIDLYDDCGWRVGQEHQTTISAIAASGTYDGVSWSVGESHSSQTITLVLMHKGGYQLVTPVKDKSGANRSTCSFVVGMKDCLNVKGYMNSSNTNSGSWNACARRGWCNGGFRGALPSSLQSAFKLFSCVTGTWLNDRDAGGSNITTQDYFALFAEKGVFNARTYSTTTEFNALSSITWYETTSNRIKNVNGSADIWWERSPSYYASSGFCNVYSSGNVGSVVAVSPCGLAPFGCM